MRFALLLFTLLFGVCSMAQNYVDLAKVFYANTPVNQNDTGSYAGSRVEEYGVDLLTPVELKNNNALLFGLYAESVNATVAPKESNLTSVYTTLLKVGVKLNHGERWSGSYLLLPKFSSDFKGSLNANDFQIGAYALLNFQQKENWKWKFGIYANTDLFGPFFVPLIGFYHQSQNKKWEVNLTLPLAADANYSFNKSLRAGMNFAAFVRSYNLNEPYQGNPENYLVKASNELFTYLQIHATPSAIFQLKVGYSIGRNYRIYDIKDRVTWGLSAFRFGDDRQQLNSDFADGLIFRARFIYRFHLE
ncbi:MAG: DUF6268 family outer membrane beta-barrel protein [Schleiferiaceae bacterium]|jgi:hypothetical protein|nr:DUF6268 family outer membrane beta-barrel protein [Schleiferiaceae bacterium]